MKKESLRKIMQTLQTHEVRFLLVGGLAVNAHGLIRHTVDVDLVIQLQTDNIVKAFQALSTLGYRPMIPVNASEFADTQQRSSWIREKGMRVLQFRSNEHRTVTIDVFVEEPFPFDEEYDHALLKDLIGGIPVRVVTLKTLIKMKEAAGRPRDLSDIAELQHRLK
ncbi:MAG: hypothetical protein HJJLKODD_02971 [Phycisphaerae bacterium]|nr:hypothetical protein [Phycisphaerae bacterium]